MKLLTFVILVVGLIFTTTCLIESLRKTNDGYYNRDHSKMAKLIEVNQRGIQANAQAISNNSVKLDMLLNEVRGIRQDLVILTDDVIFAETKQLNAKLDILLNIATNTVMRDCQQGR